MSPALNPLAFAAATLSLGAHAVVVGVLLIKPADEPAEVAHLVTIVTESTQPSAAAEQHPAPPPVVDEASRAGDVQPAPPSALAPTARVIEPDSPGPTALAQPRNKPAARADGLESIAIVRPTEVARLDPARTEPPTARTNTRIETRISIRPGNSQPHYPLVARKRGYQGQAIIRVELSPTGEVTTARVAESSGYAMLDTAARDAVRNWQFAPATRDGRPVAGQIDVPIEFRLR